MSKELLSTPQVSPFAADEQSFTHAQRVAGALCASNLVPEAYRGTTKDKIANTLVAMEYAYRVNMSVFAVMQNLHVIHGKPSPSATFIIGAINACGRFEPLKFKMSGDGDTRACVAWTTDKTGEILESPPVSIAMAKAEGWYGRNGSKWKTMPELMLRYRAAAFFGRLYAPEILLGMQTSEEREDIGVGARERTAQKLPDFMRQTPPADAPPADYDADFVDVELPE